MRSFLLSHLLNHQAKRDPNRIALEIDDEETTYGQLQEISKRLARTLADGGVRYLDRVGIYLGKSQAAYGAIFATLELGAAYVPLDPSAPAARIRTIIADCALSALITTPALADGLRGGAAWAETLQLVVLSGEASAAPTATPATGAGHPAIISWQQALTHLEPLPANPAIEDDLAYALYTSGSTGMPKGVMMSHRGGLAFVEWAIEALGMTASDRVAAVAGMHFDLSILDLFATIAVGATLLPIPERSLLRPSQLTRWIAERQISVWYSTPSTLILLLEEGQLERHSHQLKLHRLLFAGEVFPTKYLRRLRQVVPAAELYNLYGPTETNVCTWKHVVEIPEDDRETIPIGRACANTMVAAVDDQGHEVKVGEEGELWVRGPTVMRGYWGDQEKTASVLRRRPGFEPQGGLWYRTGDLVRQDESGDYHFRGRRDHMVKIRGYRVEIGEIEAALYSHPNIKELAVVPVAAERYGQKLRAYVVAHEKEQYSVIQLKAFLGEHLPAYMIPGEVRRLDTLPKTSTGKVDRRSLADTP